MKDGDPKHGRRNHVVPAAYLRHFASRPGMIWRYDHKHRHWSEVSIRRQAAVVEDFYSPQVESWLASEVENSGVRILRRLAESDGSVRLNEDEAKSVALYVVVQRNRTPAALERWWGPRAAVAVEEHKDLIGKDPTIDRMACLSREIQRDPERAGSFVVTELGGPFLEEALWRQADDLLLLSRWFVRAAPDDVGLVTSDSPVLSGLHAAANVRWALFPLTRRRYLFCFGVEGGDRFSGLVESDAVPPAPAKNINSQIVSAARRYVYSSKREWWVEGVFTKERIGWWGRSNGSGTEAAAGPRRWI